MRKLWCLTALLVLASGAVVQAAAPYLTEKRLYLKDMDDLREYLPRFEALMARYGKVIDWSNPKRAQYLDHIPTTGFISFYSGPDPKVKPEVIQIDAWNQVDFPGVLWPQRDGWMIYLQVGARKYNGKHNVIVAMWQEKPCPPVPMPPPVVAPPNITVAPPNVTVAPPNITVAPPNVTVNVTVPPSAVTAVPITVGSRVGAPPVQNGPLQVTNTASGSAGFMVAFVPQPKPVVGPKGSPGEPGTPGGPGPQGPQGPPGTCKPEKPVPGQPCPSTGGPPNANTLPPGQGATTKPPGQVKDPIGITPKDPTSPVNSPPATKPPPASSNSTVPVPANGSNGAPPVSGP